MLMPRNVMLSHSASKACGRRADSPDHNPTHSILAATHSVEFAERWGRRVRYDIAAGGHVLDIRFSEDSKAAARWSLESGGEYYGVGAGTGISGFRANLGVGDDLFGSSEDAYSETDRAIHASRGSGTTRRRGGRKAQTQ